MLPTSAVLPLLPLAGQLHPQVLDWLTDWGSCHVLSLVFTPAELSSYLHPVESLGASTLDLQLGVSTDLSHLSEAERAGAHPRMVAGERRRRGWGWRSAWRQQDAEREFNRINSVGRTMQRLRCREGVREGVRWADGWGDVARSPQWRARGVASPRQEQEDSWRGDPAPGSHLEESWVHLEQGYHQEQEQQMGDNTIEIQSPEQWGAPHEAFGDITRSPQSPDWRGGSSPDYSPNYSAPSPLR